MRLFYILIVFCIFTGIVVGQQTVYTTSGSHTFTTHSSVIELTAEAIGGGGGGGLVRRSSATKSGGGGGAAYAKGKVNVTPNTGHPVYVARGGKKQQGDSDARHGENSWFYSGTSTDASITVRAAGGQTLLHNDNQDVAGKPGGDAANCVGNVARYTGGHGGSTNSNDYGGGGGGAAGSTGAGNAGGQYAAGSANGGILLSGHAPGNGGVGGVNGGDDDGVSGYNYGGGGGGARKSNSVFTSNRNGSPGAIGIVVVSWSQIDNIASVCQGSTSTTITGFNFQTTMPDGITSVTTTSVTLNGTPLAYTVNSNTQITINLPVGATSGNVIVSTTLGRAQYTLTINSNTASIAPISVSGGGNYCFGNQVTLTANGSTLGTGASYGWYTGSCGGTLVATTTTPTYTFTPSSGGITNYYVRAEGTCNTTSCASASVILPTPNTLATTGESATCNVNAGETVHFFEQSSGNYIASVTAGASSLGSVQATAFVESAPLLVPACSSPDAMHATHVLGRHWVITPTNNFPATVRLPYYTAEINALMPAANGNSNPVDNVGGIGDLQLSKYSGGPWPGSVNVDSDPFNNCAPPVNTGVGGTTIQGPVSSGSISYLSGFASHLYSEFAITGFSEFWLHGGTSSTPLAVTLSQFSATCSTSGNKLSWTTETEQNSSYFEVERSRDGENWELITTISGAGNTNTSKNYKITDDASSGEHYYRLQQVDFNGKKGIIGVKFLECESSENKLIVYPNPAQELFTIDIHSDEKITDGLIQLHDLTGKIVLSKDIFIKKGVNSVYFNQHSLRRGTYILSVQGESAKFKPVQLIIR